MAIARRLPNSEIPPPNPEEIEDLCNFLTSSIGITADSQRLARMLFKVEKRMVDIGIKNWSEYYQFLNSNHEEFLVFAALMTVNKTNFFREEKHFKVLRDRAIEFNRSNQNSKFLCWSAACSTGEEVYSLAMTLNELKASSKSNFDFGILGSDINRDVLQQAEAGIYSEDVVCREVPMALRKRYFLRGRDAQSGLYKVDTDLRSKTKFRMVNLVRSENGPGVKFNAIFLRNVLIYFNAKTQREAILNVSRHLHPDGLLFLGLCERLPDNIPNLRALGSSVYCYQGGS